MANGTSKKALAKMLNIREAGLLEPGTIRHIDIAHDGWCSFLRGNGSCNCNPEVRLRPEAKK